MDKNRRAQLLRHGVQLAAFLLAPALFATVLGALGAVVTSVAGGSPAGLATPLLTLGVVLLVTALWGRVFCGWLCAFGALGDLIGFVARRLHIPQFPRSVKVDRALRWVKYAVLAFLVVAVWLLALPIDASWSPWSAFGLLTSRNPSVMRAALATVGGALLLGIVVASLFVERFFCRCLCPLGALLAPVSRLRLFRVTRKAGCTGCAACTRACPMNVPVHEGGAANSGECIGCLRCTGACPAACLSASPSPALAGATVAAATAGLLLLGGGVTATTAKADDPAPTELNWHTEKLPRGEERTQTPDAGQRRRRDREGQTPELETGEIPQHRFGKQSEAPQTPVEDETAAFADGVYTGVGTGYRGETTVQVTVAGGKIAEIEVVSYRDDRSFFERAKGVIQSILSRQSVEVDTVSGATYSSRGILAAVADALDIEYEAAQNAVRGARGM